MDNLERELCRKTDYSNFTDFYQDFAPQVQSVMNRFLSHRRETVEDLTHDVFIKALTKIHQYAEGTNFKAWMLSIARNTAINSYRKNKRYQRLLEEHADDFTSAGAPSSEMEYIRRVSFGQAVDLVSRTVHSPFREALFWFTEEYTYAEIAEKQEVAVGTIMSRLSRSRKLAAHTKKKMYTLLY